MILSEREYHKMPVELKNATTLKMAESLIVSGFEGDRWWWRFLEIFFYINVDNKNPFVEKGNHLIIWRNGECHKAEYFIGEKR